MTYRYFQSRTLSYCMWGRFISRYKETDTVATVAEADKISDSFSMIQMQIGTDHVATVAEADRNRPFCYDSDAYAEADRNRTPFAMIQMKMQRQTGTAPFAIIQMKMRRQTGTALLL